MRNFWRDDHGNTIATNSNREAGRAGVRAHPRTVVISRACIVAFRSRSPSVPACDTLPTWPNRSSRRTSNSAFSRWPRRTAWR
jgi:hypothetical protein